MNRWLIRLGLLFLLVVFMVSPVRAAPSVDDVARQLVCQCGCLMILNNCVHGECTSRDTMLAIIEQKIAQGQSSEQIVQAFVNQYGEQVLAEPPKRGFNLTAWLFPFVALAIGGVIIYVALKKWLRRGEPPVSIMPETEEEYENYRQRLEQELKEFPERGFR